MAFGVGKPVVFITETLSDKEPWETLIQAALFCQNAIHSLGVTDVELEEQATDVPFAATKELNTFIDPARTSSMVFLEDLINKMDSKIR